MILPSPVRPSRGRAPTSSPHAGAVSLGLMLALATTACGGADGQDKAGAKRGAKGPAEVGYVIAKPTAVQQLAELPGRTTAFQTSEVRPQVSGLIRRRLFTEGAIVRAGQTLYEIDPSLYMASLQQAQANLASAQASAEAARTKADRYRPLADQQAVSAQDYTDALALARQAEAAVAQQRALLATARINLRFTRVPAPITGRIGRSLFTQGALVTTNQTDPLATIQRLDPIYVDIQQSSADLLRLRRALANGGAMPTTAPVRLLLEDGSDYGETGTVEFAEVTVDQATGTVTLRARFPNRQGLLLPGMFVRARFAQALATQSYLVPQQAVARDARGNASVVLVGDGNKAVPRSVTTVRTQGADWVVSQGLSPGDKIIVEGLARAKPGTAVKPVPFGTPQKVVAPGGDAKPAQAGR